MTVQVVELTDSRDPGLQHLSEHEPAVVEVVGGPPLGEAIHLVAPLPEVATARLNLSSQQTLEGMTVDVGQAGNRPALQGDGVGRRRCAFAYGLDASGLDFDQHVFAAMAQPRLLGVPAT